MGSTPPRRALGLPGLSDVRYSSGAMTRFAFFFSYYFFVFFRPQAERVERRT
jgi:hypothetical protein